MRPDSTATYKIQALALEHLESGAPPPLAHYPLDLFVDSISTQQPTGSASLSPATTLDDSQCRLSGCKKQSQRDNDGRNSFYCSSTHRKLDGDKYRSEESVREISKRASHIAALDGTEVVAAARFSMMQKQRVSEFTALPRAPIVLLDVHAAITLTHFVSAIKVNGDVSSLLPALRPFAPKSFADANPLLVSLQKEAGAGYSSAANSQLGCTLRDMTLASLSQISEIAICPVELIGLITVHVNLFPRSTAALTCALRLNLLQPVVDYHLPATLQATVRSLRQDIVDSDSSN